MRDDRNTNARLGQFSDLGADDHSEDSGVVRADALEALFTELAPMLDGWADEDADARTARWTAINEKHGAAILSLAPAEIDALDDEQRVALLAALSLRASAGAAVPAPAAVAEPAAEPEPVATDSTSPPGIVPARPVFGADAPADAVPAPDAVPGEVPVLADAGDDLGDDRWHAIIFVEGVRTNDGRMAQPGGISTRPLPLPLQYTTETTYGHEGAQLGGAIEQLMRDPLLADRLAEGGFLSLADGATLLVAEGGYDAGDEGQELRRLVNAQMLRFVSADLEILEATEVLAPGGDPENYFDYDLLVTRGNVMGATACPFPAFQQCVIAPMSMDLFEAATQGIDDSMLPPEPTIEPVPVSAAGGPEMPPAAWFTSPRFGADDLTDARLVEDPDYPGQFYCPHTETPDGRVFGHAAAWHREHIGYAQRRVVAPHSSSDYAHFATGTIVVDVGEGATDVVRCGVITMDTGHADTTGANASPAATKRHYDDTGTAIADIEIGEDEHGIWYSGALRHDVPEDKMRAFRAASLSGDWRPIGASSELVGLLAVNVPGFPLPRPRRSYRIESGQEQELALVAAGFVPPRDPMHDLVHREITVALAPIRAMLDELTPLVLARQASRLDG